VSRREYHAQIGRWCRRWRPGGGGVDSRGGWDCGGWAEALCFFETSPGTGHRVGRLAEDRNHGLETECAQLLHGRRALKVAPDHDRIAALGFEPASELGRVRGLTCTLQAGHEDHGGRLGREGDLHRLAAERVDQLLVDDLDDLLRRVERLVHFPADTGGLYPFLESLDNVEVDVGFEQSEAYLAEDLVDVVFLQRSFATDTAENAFKPV